jgi:perosamine synthetase
MSWKIPLFKIYWDEKDVEKVSEAIRKGMNWATGPNVEALERMIAEYLRVKYCLTFNSGTSALHALLYAHGIGKGDEVIVPSFTFIATANAPLFVGAKPIFADIETETYGLSPESVKEKITKNTKAILPITYGGSPCLIRELKEIAEDNNLTLVEDAAESLGAGINGKRVGSFGDSAIFSFCAPKVITTGEGGAIVTDSREVYEKAKLIRSHGRLETADYFSSTGYMDYISLGYNFRMSNITAALGIAQLEKIDEIIALRRRNAKYMSEKLSKINEIILPKEPEGYFHVYQMYTIRVKEGGKKVRDGLMNYLIKKGIMCKVYFEPVHFSHFYMNEFGHTEGELPITETVSDQVLTLPMFPELSKEEIDYIAEEIQNFFSAGDNER